MLVVEGTTASLDELKALHVAIDEVQMMHRIPTDGRHNAKIDYAALAKHFR